MGGFTRRDGYDKFDYWRQSRALFSTLWLVWVLIFSYSLPYSFKIFFSNSAILDGNPDIQLDNLMIIYPPQLLSVQHLCLAQFILRKTLTDCSFILPPPHKMCIFNLLQIS